MKTLLRIDASARIHDSATRQLADDFQARWQKLHPGGEIVRRDLAAEPVPHLSSGMIEAFQGPAAGSLRELSDLLVRELASADFLLIASPIYNLSLPSTLKAYLDHVVRAGLTFETTEGGYRGLLRDKAALLLTARGGPGTPGDEGDFQTAYLRAILGFIGIESVQVIAAAGTALGAPAREEGLGRARRQLEGFFETADAPFYQGPFDESDKREIAALRRAQAAAIVDGDAEAYAALCTDDIQLLVPGFDIVSGRDAFLEAERALFARACISSFEKYPLRVERNGELAVEIGRQEVTSDRRNGGRDRGQKGDGVYSARQKYTHILRRTSAGWRFAVLTSSPCE